MTVTLNSLDDFTLDSFRRVAWAGETVDLGTSAWRRVEESRTNFLRLLDSDPNIFIYGVTTGFGDAASKLLDAEGRERQAKRPAYSLGLGVGAPLEPRVVRGIVFARLAAFIEGHAAVSRPIVEAVVSMLDGRPLPLLPLSSQIASGEVDPLNAVFGHLIGDPCEMKDGGSLVNGAPCSAALLADAVLRAKGLLDLAPKVFALSVEACRAPLEAYDPVLATVWKDPAERTALEGLNRVLEGADLSDRPPYQAPVSWRIVPRVLAQGRRALSAGEVVAEASLSTPGDNPIYFLPDDNHPHGRCVSNGSFHDAAASPAIDALSYAWADMALLADRHVVKLHHPNIIGNQTGLRYLDHGHNTRPLAHSTAWFSRKARERALPTFLPAEDAGSFKSDVLLPTFLAYEKETEVGHCLAMCLASLAAVVSQALWATDKAPAPPLRDLLAEVREHFPPVDSLRGLGPGLESLSTAFLAKLAPETAGPAP